MHCTMFQKNIFKILMICLALEQICLAKPTNNEVKEKNALCDYKTTLATIFSSEKDGQLPPSVQLLNFVAAGLMNNTITFAEKVKHLGEQILKDEEILQIENNDEVKVFIQNLNKSQEELKRCQDFNEIDDLLNSFLTDYAKYYHQEKLEKLSSNDEVILEVLKKHDFEKPLNELDIDTNKFLKNFDEKYEILKEPIGKENNKIGEKISQWYEEFKTMKLNRNKINAFPKFIELYESEFGN